MWCMLSGIRSSAMKSLVQLLLVRWHEKFGVLGDNARFVGNFGFLPLRRLSNRIEALVCMLLRIPVLRDVVLVDRERLLVSSKSTSASSSSLSRVGNFGCMRFVFSSSSEISSSSFETLFELFSDLPHSSFASSIIVLAVVGEEKVIVHVCTPSAALTSKCVARNPSFDSVFKTVSGSTCNRHILCVV